MNHTLTIRIIRMMLNNNSNEGNLSFDEDDGSEYQRISALQGRNAIYTIEMNRSGAEYILLNVKSLVAPV